MYVDGNGKTAWLLFGAAGAVPLVVALLVLRPVSGPPVPAAGHHAMQAGGTTAAGIADGTARPRTLVRPLSCEPLPHVPGKSVTTAVVEFPPGAFTARHRHPGSVTAYVTRGSIRSQLEGGPAEVYPTGGTWFEPPGIVHLFAENPSATEPAELLAVFVADNDCGPLTIFD